MLITTFLTMQMRIHLGVILPRELNSAQDIVAVFFYRTRSQTEVSAFKAASLDLT